MTLQGQMEFTDPTASMRMRRDDRLMVDQPLDGETGRSNFAAFLLGGVVIAGGMLGFLYYDAGGIGRGDGLTTRSIAPIERGVVSIPKMSVQPSR